MNPKRYSRVLNPSWIQSFPDEVPTESEWLSYDVDEYWEDVAGMDLESELIHKLSDYEFWQVTLQHMGLSDNARKDFRKAFFAPEAFRGRNEAIYGLSRARRLSEETLVKAARSYWDHMLSDMAGEDDEAPAALYIDEDGMAWDCGKIGWEFVLLVVHPDKTVFGKLAAAATEAPANQETTSDAGLSKAWRGFCQFVQKNQKLPTIGEFQTAAGLGFSVNDQTYGTKRRARLGLKLPKS